MIQDHLDPDALKEPANPGGGGGGLPYGMDGDARRKF